MNLAIAISGTPGITDVSMSLLILPQTPGFVHPVGSTILLF